MTARLERLQTQHPQFVGLDEDWTNTHLKYHHRMRYQQIHDKTAITNSIKSAIKFQLGHDSLEESDRKLKELKGDAKIIYDFLVAARNATISSYEMRAATALQLLLPEKPSKEQKANIEIVTQSVRRGILPPDKEFADTLKTFVSDGVVTQRYRSKLKDEPKVMATLPDHLKDVSMNCCEAVVRHMSTLEDIESVVHQYDEKLEVIWQNVPAHVRGLVDLIPGLNITSLVQLIADSQGNFGHFKSRAGLNKWFGLGVEEGSTAQGRCVLHKVKANGITFRQEAEIHSCCHRRKDICLQIGRNFITQNTDKDGRSLFYRQIYEKRKAFEIARMGTSGVATNGYKWHAAENLLGCHNRAIRIMMQKFIWDVERLYRYGAKALDGFLADRFVTVGVGITSAERKAARDADEEANKRIAASKTKKREKRIAQKAKLEAKAAKHKNAA